MERTQFTFYESFYKAAHRIKKKSDRADAYDAICAYALYGEMPALDSLPDAVAIAFELSKPNLDASRKKAESGKRGGRANGKQNESKPEAKDKQTVSKKEKENENKKEKELEIEIEYKCNNNLHDVLQSARVENPELAKVASAYMNMINPTPSQSCLDELRIFVEELGADVVIEALNVALDEKKTSWSYIRAILRNYHAAGVRCLADVQRIRDERERLKAANMTAKGGNTRPNNSPAPPGTTNPFLTLLAEEEAKQHGSG